MKLIGKGLLIFIVFLISIIFVNAAEPGTVFGRCAYSTGPGYIYLTYPQAECPLSIVDGLGNAYYFSSWADGYCAATGDSTHKCRAPPDSNTYSSDSSASICSTKITETPDVGTLYCKCGSHIYARSDSGYCVDGTYTQQQPGGNPEPLYDGNGLVFAYPEIGKELYKGLREHIHMSCQNWPVNCAANGNGDGWYYWAAVYVKQDSTIRIRFDEVDDYFNAYFFPIVNPGLYTPIEGKVLTFDLSKDDIKTGWNWNTNGSGAHTLSVIAPRGFYLFYVRFDDFGGNRYLYDLRFVDELDNNVGLEKYFTLFYGIEPAPLSGYPDFNQIDLSDAEFRGFLDGDVNDSICGPELLEKSWSANAANLPEQRRCCGDDPKPSSQGGDLYYIDQESGLMCNNVGGWRWESISGSETCPWYEGQSHFIPELITTLGSDYDPDALNGADACCGDDPGDAELFFEPFNDNSNGWYMPPAIQPLIEDGFLKLITSDTFRIVKPFTTQSKVTFTIKDNPTTYSSILTVFFVMADGETGFFINNDNITLEGCTPLRITGDPYRMHGIMLPSGTPGTDRSCNITVIDSRLKYLRYMVYQTAGEAWVDYITVSLPLEGGDYGYVTPDNKYLCYNNRTNFNGGTTDKWMWIYAPEKPFLITPLNFSGKTVDYISNSEDWYYCDANAPEGLKGLSVEEYKTFPNPEFGGLLMTCSEAATFLTTPYNQLPYEDCATAQGPNCCVDFYPRFNILENPEIFKSQCYCRTASVTGQEDLFCNIEENKRLPICQDYSFTNDKILTEFCAQNPRNCVTLDHYDTTKSCSAQPFNLGHTCNSTQVCSNGIMMSVLYDEPCCIGVSASCIEKSQITTQQICEESGGTPYTPSNTTFCLPENQSIYMSLEEGSCCFGAILHTDNFPWSSFENINNNTFSCFAYQGNSLFGQCCYGLCNSMSLFNSLSVDANRNRAFSIKLPFNIQNSYDLYNVSGGILQDFSWKTTTPNFDFYQVAYFPGKKNISMAYYDNLEFDIIYNQVINVKNISINGVDYGSVTNYVNNGEKRGIAHHVKIPLRPESKMDQLRNIKMSTNSSNVNVLYDNIYFSINTDTPESSLNYYCTGGFASWISDMDPPITDINNMFFTGENAYMEGYGKYAITCNAYLPYGWTGHYCCGDDTNQTNYGEYYEDSPNPTWPTSGGCFAGSKVVEGETVWKVKGYLEDNTAFFDSDDELKSFTHSDLIYYDNSFVGCQVPNNKYLTLRKSYDGMTLEPTELITTFVNNQCAVIGTYYCMNGIWRQYVPGLSQNYNLLNNIYLPSIPSELHLKSIPPAQLFKNPSFKQGMDYWYPTTPGWSVNTTLERLIGNSSGLGEIVIFSSPFDLKSNTTYNINVHLYNTGCTITADFNNGACLSANSFLQQNCFTDVPHSDNSNYQHTLQWYLSTPTSDDTDALQGFFRNVSLRLRVSSGCYNTAFFEVLIKEISDIEQPLQPQINLTTACCPKEYCWDGSQCVLSDPWYLSNNSNLWSLLDIDGQINKHINTSMQWLAKGYRCTLNGTGYADWTPAEIKYDWDFKESGYCIRETDCFVSNTFNGHLDIPFLLGETNINNSGSSCIQNGQFINNSYEINKGNHYCLNGEWTTKTYLIANVLENITKGKPYIIFCDDTGRIFNNIMAASSEDDNKISGGCVLLSKEGNTERIITGFYVEDPILEMDSGNLVCGMYRKHIADVTGDAPPCEYIFSTHVNPDYVNCMGYGTRTFTYCGSYPAPSNTGNTGLYLYFNNNTAVNGLYYLMSNQKIPEIENNFFYNLWNAISNFFKRLFGYTPTDPLGLASQTTNYDRIYILSNRSLNVSAIEESKYDEELAEVMVYMYLNMTNPGISQANNPFNTEFVNKSVGGAYYTFIEGPNSQVLTIKYSQPAKLWPYLTAMLRDRP